LAKLQNIGVHVTRRLYHLLQLSVINDPVPLAHFFLLVTWLEVPSDPTQCACIPTRHADCWNSLFPKGAKPHF